MDYTKEIALLNNTINELQKVRDCLSEPDGGIEHYDCYADIKQAQIDLKKIQTLIEGGSL